MKRTQSEVIAPPLFQLHKIRNDLEYIRTRFDLLDSIGGNSRHNAINLSFQIYFRQRDILEVLEYE